MGHSFSRLMLAGGIVAAVVVAGHAVSTQPTGALGLVAGSTVGGQLGHNAGSLGGGKSTSKSGAQGSHTGGNPNAPIDGSGATVTGVAQSPEVNTGLLMRSPSQPPANLTPYVDGSIIEAAWNTMQPTQGALVTSRIDKAVAAVRKWNTANPNNRRGLRLRITAGFNTPSWALNLGGAAVHLCSQSGNCGLVPRWWTAPVQAAYAAYTQKLAAYVNNIPEIREVTVGLTMVRWGEVMVRFPTAGGNAAAYANAGYTEALDIVAMKAEVNDGKAFNAVTQIDVADYQTPSNGQDISVSKEIMDYAVATLPHVQFANASITQSPGQNAAIFSLMQTYGAKGNMSASITFQTYPTLSSVSDTLARAVGYGACSVEMPQSGVTPSIASTFDSQLRANCEAEGIVAPATPPPPQGGTVLTSSLTAARLSLPTNASWNGPGNASWTNDLTLFAHVSHPTNASWNGPGNASWTNDLTLMGHVSRPTNASWDGPSNASWSGPSNASWTTDL
jgi:uncharacterized protein (DUF697 family)